MSSAAISLLPADARSRRADVGHDQTGKAGGVEAGPASTEPPLEPRRGARLPERIALHFMRSEPHVTPALGALQIIVALGKPLARRG